MAIVAAMLSTNILESSIGSIEELFVDVFACVECASEFDGNPF